MLLAADSGTVGANHEFAPFVGYSIWPAREPHVVRHGFAGFEHEGSAVVHRADHIHSRRTKWDQKAVAIFQRQVGKSGHTVGVRLEFQDDAPRSLQSLHAVDHGLVARGYELGLRIADISIG